MWQEHIAADCRDYDESVVNIVAGAVPTDFDTINCVGGFKTTMNTVYAIGAKKAYIFNIPRHVQASTRDEALRAIGYIKKGFLWRFRGEFKEILFDPPQVWVFVADMPGANVLKKRWKYWRICPETLKLERID